MSVSALAANAAASLNTYSSLGTASEVRAELLSNNVVDKAFELKCGKDSTKTKDGKCGAKTKDGKCGAKGKKGAKAKTKDAKCGEGKCGGDKKK